LSTKKSMIAARRDSTFSSSRTIAASARPFTPALGTVSHLRLNDTAFRRPRHLIVLAL
jgi:hypothetical protein